MPGDCLGETQSPLAVTRRPGPERIAKWQSGKLRPAGDKADGKPGCRLLRQLLTYFAQDTILPVGRSETVGQRAAKLVQTALDHLAAGNAEEAVKWTIHAMAEYCDLEKRDLRFENSDEKRDLAEWWKRHTEPAVKREIKRYVRQAEKHRLPESTINDAVELMAKQHGKSPRPKKTTAAKSVAKKLGIKYGTVPNYRTVLNHLPPWLQVWND